MLLQLWPKHTDIIDTKIQELNKLSDKEWRERGEKTALALFYSAAKKVPAYKKFLAEHNIDPKEIKSIDDFATVPCVTKENYLRKYSLSELTWDGNIGGSSVINRSSGSSGKPFYWLSNEHQRKEVSEFYELIFSTMFDMRRKKTLVIVAYGMGSWVAGTTTLLSTVSFMNRYNCTVMTPGYNRKEVIEICRDLGKEYDQIVICAYPPLAKEIIDLGVQEGISWSKLKPKFVFGAEAFSENFREYVLAQTGSKNYFTDTMNTIGSADAMVIGHETPLSIALRKHIISKPLLHDSLLGNGRMPTVAQYYPWQKYLQAEGDELVITSNGAIPLIRYNIQDNAKLYTYEELKKHLSLSDDKDLSSVLPKGLRGDYNWKLPFVLLYGKSTNAVKFYGAFVYPENVKAALEKSEHADKFTGKFRIEKYLDGSQDQRLRLMVELAPGVVSKDISIKQLQNKIAKTISSLNTEYKCVYVDTGRKTVPLVKLVAYGSFDLSNTQNKHKYA